jgi:myo-inositol-1(or 4)-monophosphatase
VAVGKLEAFYEVGLKPWDVAAAGHLVLEAGGSLSDFRGEETWLYGREIIAGTAPIHAWLTGILQKYMMRSTDFEQ